MKRKSFFIFLSIFLNCILSYSKISISIYEPIRFKDVNTRSIGELVIGEGTLEIISDNIEEDLDKKIIFNFAETGLLNNGKRWIKIEKYEMNEKEKELIIKEEKKRVKFYAYVKKSELNDNIRNAEDIEGLYKGRVAIVAELYGKPIIIENKEVEKKGE